MRKILALIILLIGSYFGYQQVDSETGSGSPQNVTLESWQSGDQVRGRGAVVRILSDDNQGSRHQRFIVRLDGNRTVLVAHNIDLAPRVAGLAEGDSVSFYGQFETNQRGGVIHWTHKDPQGRHVDGWLEHAGKRYE